MQVPQHLSAIVKPHTGPAHLVCAANLFPSRWAQSFRLKAPTQRSHGRCNDELIVDALSTLETFEGSEEFGVGALGIFDEGGKFNT